MNEGHFHTKVNRWEPASCVCFMESANTSIWFTYLLLDLFILENAKTHCNHHMSFRT